MMCLVGDSRATADVLDTVTAGVLEHKCQRYCSQICHAEWDG